MSFQGRLEQKRQSRRAADIAASQASTNTKPRKRRVKISPVATTSPRARRRVNSSVTILSATKGKIKKLYAFLVFLFLLAIMELYFKGDVNFSFLESTWSFLVKLKDAYYMV